MFGEIDKKLLGNVWVLFEVVGEEVPGSIPLTGQSGFLRLQYVPEIFDK